MINNPFNRHSQVKRQWKSRMLAAKSPEEVYDALHDACDVLSYHWNRERSFRHNAHAAELNLNSGAANAFELAHTKLAQIFGIEP